MVQVQIISKETIKPSSPTPQHLQNFKLSLLDQLIPAPYAPIVLFYPNITNNVMTSHLHQEVDKRLVLLKKSLSETLTRFYPLAGLIQDDLSINCNDEGAYFAVAEVNTNISTFLECPDLELINKFLPCEPSFNESSKKTHVTNIQVNVFECGGFSISLCVSHKILDGAALSTFLKSWWSKANGDEAICPDFIASSMFPTNELWLKDASMVMWGSLFKKGKCVTRRIVFDAPAIATLKAYANGSNVQHPTRVEVVSSFLWKCGMAASAKKNGVTRPSILSHVVNLRKRNIPTLSDLSIGNIIWFASAKCKEKFVEVGFEGLVDKVRRGILKINGDFVKKMRGDKGPKVMSKCLKKMGTFGSKEEVDYYGFTSWCKFGFYEADFGWGKPVWVSSVGLNGAPVFMNLIIFMDTKCGQGIEAWVTLDEQEMNILEHDLELLALASVDPSTMRNQVFSFPS